MQSHCVLDPLSSQEISDIRDVSCSIYLMEQGGHFDMKVLTQNP
jgi:hypothetical protein